MEDYKKGTDEILKEYNTSLNGLNSNDVKLLFRKYGKMN